MNLNLKILNDIKIDNFQKSPNFPAYYPADAFCTWTVHIAWTGEDYEDFILFSFEEMAIEDVSTCWADSVELFDGKDSSAKDIKIFLISK